MEKEVNSLVDSPYDIDITYEILFAKDQPPATFRTKRNLNETPEYPDNLPSWTFLSYKKCPGCKLNETEKYCPAAASIADLVSYFSEGDFPAKANVNVIYSDKTISAVKPLKNILSALIGMRMASSGCPALTPFKMMVRFHSPFDSPYSAVYRATSSFLLTEALNKENINVQESLKELQSFYDYVSTLNLHFAKRLEKNCSACSMNLLSVFTITMRLLFQEHLEILKGLT